MMRTELQEALEGFKAGFRHANWYGKTRRQFWGWFGEHEVALLARAGDAAEREAIAAALYDARALADDMGYAGPPEGDGSPIERPAPIPGDREALDRQLDALRAAMPEILALPETDHMDAFAGIADGIEAAAGAAHRSYVWTQLQCILRDSGLIPGDDEPCGD